jgi:ribonuclease P protein component
MRTSQDFRSTTQRGRRTGSASLVLHADLDPVLGPALDSARHPGPPRAALVGFVVGKNVGGSVVRHRVARRLRAQMTQRLDRLPDGSRVVVRALPPAARASSARLGADLDAALAKAVRSR